MLVAPVATEPRSLAVGGIADGRFRVIREIGVGGMGTVYEAQDLQTSATVALKLMRQELTGDPRAVERFRREGAALAAIRHAAVVQIREVGAFDDGTLYLAMELLRGETLASRLSRVGRMDSEQLLPIVLALCDGLAAAHAGGVIHRDIKPSNVHLPDPDCVDSVGKQVCAKLVDFGVARVRGFSRMTSSGLAVGTVRYMAPEQLSGGAVDERVDVYSLGVVLFEALAGEHPFERTEGDDPIGAILVGRATPLSTLRPEVSPAITRVVHKAMARLPSERFASSRALADAFRRALLKPEGALFDAGETRSSLAPGARLSSRSLAGATTELAVPRARAERARPSGGSAVRRRGRRVSRAPVWLLLPLLVGMCLLPGLGIGGLVGCASWVTDFQLGSAVENVRGAIEVAPDRLGHYREDLDRLEGLHRREQVSFFASAAINQCVHDAMRDTGRLRPEDVPGVMLVVRDVLARGGAYDLQRYSEMTEKASQRMTIPAGAPVSSSP